MPKLTWIQILSKITLFLAVIEDGKVDKAEEDILVKEIAPYLADLFPIQDKPVEEWDLVQFAVKLIQETITIMKERQGEK